jgi:hypothetical protein
MSVLAEAFSVVVPVSVLKRGYPDGLDGFARDCPNGSFCSDGVLARVGFLARKDAEYFLSMLTSAGLTVKSRDVYIDAALIDQNTGPVATCLWLELGRERDGTPVCWHVAARRGVLHVPEGWEPSPSFNAAGFLGRPFGKLLRHLRGEAGRDWFHDRSSGKVFSTPRAIVLH